MSSAGLLSFQAAVEANSLAPSQRAALLEALAVVIPEFVAPDETGATERAQRMVETWGAVLYALDAEGAVPVPSTNPRAVFVMKMAVLPESDPIPSLGVLSSSTDLEPLQTLPPDTGLAELSYCFLMPEACKLGTFRAFGSSALLGTFSQNLAPLPVALYVNAVRKRTLVTLAPSTTDFDLTDPGGDAFEAGDLVQFIVEIPALVATLNGVLFAAEVMPA